MKRIYLDSNVLIALYSADKTEETKGVPERPFCRRR